MYQWITLNTLRDHKTLWNIHLDSTSTFLTPKLHLCSTLINLFLLHRIGNLFSLWYQFLHGFINGAEKFHTTGVEKGTQEKNHLERSHCMEFFKLCGISDPGTENLSSVQKVQILCGFMHDVLSRKFPKHRGRGVAVGMDKLSLDNMVSAITESGWPKPAKDYDGNTWR